MRGRRAPLGKHNNQLVYRVWTLAGVQAQVYVRISSTTWGRATAAQGGSTSTAAQWLEGARGYECINPTGKFNWSGRGH